MPPPIRHPRTIRAHLLALVAVTALPLIALLAHATRTEYRLASAQGELRAHTLADATATSAQAVVSLVREALDATANQDLATLMASPGRCSAKLRQVNDALPFLPNILLADARGRVTCTAHPAPDSLALDFSERDSFQAVMAGAPLAIGSPLVGRITRMWVVAVAVPVRDGDGTLRGVLAASLPLVTFQDLLAGVTPGPDDLVTIANADRTIVARSKDPDRWVGQSLPPETAETEEQADGYVLTEAVDAEGVRRTWASVEVPELGWTVHGGIPEAEVLAPAATSLRHRLELGALTLLLVALLAYLVQRRITRSLAYLVQLTASDGESEAADVPPGTPAEIAEVAERFDRTLQARRDAEREERRAKERYRSIFDNAVLGIFVSTEEGRFLEVNPAFATLMGYDDPAELLAAGPATLYGDPDQRKALMEAYRERSKVDGLELDWRRKDGTPVTVRLHGKVARDGADRLGFEIVVEDVTETRRLEDQLQTTQKMEAVGRLAGGLAHDFNNVLTVVRVNAELAEQEVGTGPGHEGIGEILRATEAAQNLTRQLLSFTRKRQGGARLVHPNAIARGVEKMLSRVIGDDVQLEARLETDAPWVRMDPGHLEQILMNLAINARDALPEGGRILMRTRVVRDDGPAGDEAVPERAAWVVVTVEDDGIGMDASVRKRIFEPFFTTKDVGHGTGLGLSTAYALVTDAGGRITVDSTPGEGSRFDIWLPAVLEAPPPEPGPEPTPPDARGRGETILLVEDNDAVRRAVQRTLEGAGYRVLVAADGQEGIDELHAHAGPIDLVVTDVVMPGVSGAELADHVDRVRPSTPILFTSGYTADHPVAERMSRGGVDFLPKPFEITDLLSRVRDALGRPGSARPDNGAAGRTAPGEPLAPDT